MWTALAEEPGEGCWLLTEGVLIGRRSKRGC